MILNVNTVTTWHIDDAYHLLPELLLQGVLLFCWPLLGCESIRQKIIKLPRKVWCTCINMTIHKISHRVSWIHSILYLHGNLTVLLKFSVHLTTIAPRINQQTKQVFPSRNYVEPPCPAWIPWALIWIPPHRHCWSMSQVSLVLWRGPSGGGGVPGKVRATMWCCYKDIMAKHKLFFWELNVNPCVYPESCRPFCLAFAYWIPSGVQLFFHQ